MINLLRLIILILIIFLELCNHSDLGFNVPNIVFYSYCVCVLHCMPIEGVFSHRNSSNGLFSLKNSAWHFFYISATALLEAGRGLTLTHNYLLKWTLVCMNKIWHTVAWQTEWKWEPHWIHRHTFIGLVNSNVVLKLYSLKLQKKPDSLCWYEAVKSVRTLGARCPCTVV